jgi:serine protease
MTIDPFHRRAGLIVACAVAAAALLSLPVHAEIKSVRNAAVAMPAAGKPEPVSRLIIRYRDGTKASARGGALPGAERAEAQALVVRSAARAGAMSLRYLKSVSPKLQVAALDHPVSADEAQALIQRLRADPAVLDVMVDQRVRSHAIPNDPSYTNGDQWHLRSPGEVPGGINAVAAWVRSSGANVVIAVLDGGYTAHADLLPNLLPGYDFVSGDPAGSLQALASQPFWTANDGNGRDAFALDPGDWVSSADVTAGFCDRAEDSTWHGTHVAGLAAAAGNNNLSGLGVAYGAQILPVRVLGRCGGYVSDILAGARWAAGLAVTGVPANPNPSKILSLSLGYAGVCCPIVQAALDEVRATGASLIASSGNDASTAISVPASCAGVVAVTAHTREGDVAGYANVGRNVRISAPGGGANSWLSQQPGSPRDIVATGNTGTTAPVADNTSSLRGTSMAVPQVAGVMALLAPLKATFAMSTLEAIVADSARVFPLGSYCVVNSDGLAPGFCGAGLLDAARAVQAVEAAPLLSADLSVEQRSPIGDLRPGQTVSFAVILRNAGPQAALSTTLSQVFGAGLELVSVDAPFPVSRSPSGWSGTLPGLAVNASQTVQVRAVVRIRAGSISSAAAVSSAYADAAASNNQDDVLLTVSGAPVSEGGGGGCTAAPNGQADASLLLLVFVSLGLALLRRRGR